MIRDDETINTEPMLGITVIAIIAVCVTVWLLYQYYNTGMSLLVLANGN